MFAALHRHVVDHDLTFAGSCGGSGSEASPSFGQEQPHCPSCHLSGRSPQVDAIVQSRPVSGPSYNIQKNSTLRGCYFFIDIVQHAFLTANSHNVSCKPVSETVSFSCVMQLDPPSPKKCCCEIKFMDSRTGTSDYGHLQKLVPIQSVGIYTN